MDRCVLSNHATTPPEWQGVVAGTEMQALRFSRVLQELPPDFATGFDTLGLPSHENAVTANAPERRHLAAPSFARLETDIVLLP